MRFRIFSIGIIVFLALFTFSAKAQDSVLFRFSQQPGSVLHGESIVDESVYIDGYLSHQAEIREFSVSTVRDVDQNGKAVLDTDFRTVDQINSYPGSYQWISTESTRLTRDTRGIMTVPSESIWPVLRQVPTFPEDSVAPGDTWSFPAEEVHAFNINGTLYGPYRSTTQALYRYVGDESADGLNLAHISVEYNIYLPVRKAGEPVRLLSGRSVQQLYWDKEKGRPYKKEEDFEFLLMMSNGRTQQFTGKTRTDYRVTEALDKTGAAGALRSELEKVPGVTVEPTDKGILVTLEDAGPVLFAPESADISPDQQSRLEKLAESLAAYGDRDILITGYTADYGTAEGRKSLSFRRASAVADKLFPGGRKGPGKLFLRGAGSSDPTGSDRSDRRVEILILN